VEGLLRVQPVAEQLRRLGKRLEVEHRERRRGGWWEGSQHAASPRIRPLFERRTGVGSLDGVPAALQISGLTKRYDDGFVAVDGFDLDVAAGAFFGLLGPNGAGKTTIISAVCNLIRVTAGEIDIFGEPHGSLEARRMIGLAEQDVNLDRFLDVEETLLYHGGYFGMRRAEARRRAAEMMDVFDLRAKAGVRAPKLSGGMRRRLLLARALMHEPRLVILDEPTAGVDFELRLELWRYIRRLHDEGTTILLTTHYLEEADELCEDIALIRDGRLIARDTADGLREAYAADSLADAYVRAMGTAA
jgi:ABC-2 type transport system ATP-binding protein